MILVACFLSRAIAPLAAMATLLAATAFAQSSAPARHPSGNPGIDPRIMAQTAAIKAFDNHAHPVLPPAVDPADRDFDALPVDNMEAQTDPTALRPDNPQLLPAWKALWGFSGSLPLDSAGMKRLEAARTRVRTRQGQHLSEWVLDQAGIGTMLANRVSLGAGIAPPRFRWVPYADALLLPFDTATLAAANPDRGLFFPMEDKVRARYLRAVGLQAVPFTLGEYLANVVTPTLERQRTGGAVAEKFEIAYLRTFGFTDPSQAETESVYARLASTPRPDSASYKLLQDFLFRYIARECGRLGMAVHLHAMAGGGGYFGIAGADPLLLEPIFNDPALRKTRFVLLHGGWPFIREAGALLQKPNVFLDISQQTLVMSPRTLGGWLREWLEIYPDKVLFGTDGYPYSDALGWEESTWIAARNGREALGIALTGMVRDGEISLERAGEIATLVLRGNASKLSGTSLKH